MKFFIFFVLISVALCQVTFPEEEEEQPTTTAVKTSSTKATSKIPTTSAKITTKKAATTPSESTPSDRIKPSGSAAQLVSETAATAKSTTSAIRRTTTTPELTTAEGSSTDMNNCLCVPKNSCNSVLNGNATEPEDDGSGVIEPRIINSGILNYNSYGTNVTITSPISTGINVETVSPTFCVKPDLLELCCPSTGYQCGVSFPPVSSAAAPPAGRAKYGQFPWETIIFTYNKQFYVGAGVLIDQYHVMSVAHRFERFPASNTTFKVRLGVWDTSSMNVPFPYLELNVSKVFVHPKYNKTNLKNDLIVLRLTSPVPLGRYPTITTACLPAKPIPAPTRCWISGFGQNDFINGTNQAIMKAVDVPLIDSTDCQNRLRQTALKRTFILDKESFLCAGGEVGKDACTGDGGAPLVCNVAGQWYVQGLVAWGLNCGQNIPGVYVNVSSFIPWIRSVTTLK
ncbi:hypothetical protein ACKWTF_015985 [Chironomus riparius]